LLGLTVLYKGGDVTNGIGAIIGITHRVGSYF
jgi:hypothetical protein